MAVRLDASNPSSEDLDALKDGLEAPGCFLHAEEVRARHPRTRFSRGARLGEYFAYGLTRPVDKPNERVVRAIALDDLRTSS